MGAGKGAQPAHRSFEDVEDWDEGDGVTVVDRRVEVEQPREGMRLVLTDTVIGLVRISTWAETNAGDHCAMGPHHAFWGRGRSGSEDYIARGVGSRLMSVPATRVVITDLIDQDPPEALEFRNPDGAWSQRLRGRRRAQQNGRFSDVRGHPKRVDALVETWHTNGTAVIPA